MMLGPERASDAQRAPFFDARGCTLREACVGAPRTQDRGKGNRKSRCLVIRAHQEMSANFLGMTYFLPLDDDVFTFRLGKRAARHSRESTRNDQFVMRLSVSELKIRPPRNHGANF